MGDRTERHWNTLPQRGKHVFFHRQVVLLVVFVFVIYSVATRAGGATGLLVVAIGVLAAAAGAFAGLRRRRTGNRTR